MPPKKEIEDRGDELLEEEEDLEEEDSEEEDLEEEEEEDLEEEEDSEDLEEEEEEDLEEEPDNRIPRSRLNKVIGERDYERGRNEVLEQTIERLIEKQETSVENETPPEFDFDDAEQKYIDFILEGETKKAAEVRRDINKATQELFDHKVKVIKNTASTESKQAVDEDKFNTLIETYENQYTFLDAESDDYNEEAVETVNALLAGYRANGSTKSSALRKAIKKVVPMYEKVKNNNSKKTISKRKKNINAIRKQPPKSKGKRGGTRDISDLDISKMSDKELDSLTEREMKVLRGDTL